MGKRMKVTVGEVAQCAVSAAVGCWLYWVFMDDPNPKVPLLIALVGGFSSGWASTFLYVWLRFGWKAARSMSMSP
ncbi:hypothetical protein FBZ85_11641 [Azospirillum brasilense]|uniref:Uncharacterized protein n=2 Tax=Azospirillum baldaniorum TaxID=1064539 RepID=A0A9P1NN60_9PROT|nr:hypothetical protein FBZ85_11641 [Azospirillum brasilense]CCC99348.1 protein of unknown function [Azospirillum baldaniorum]